MELFLFKDFKLHIHFAVFAYIFDLLLFDSIHNIFQVKILFSKVVPVNADSFGILKDVLVPNDSILFFEKFASLIHFGWVQFLYLLFFLQSDLLSFKCTFIMFVLWYKFTVIHSKIFFGEYFIKIRYDPIFIVEHEIILDSCQFEMFLSLINF